MNQEETYVNSDYDRLKAKLFATNEVTELIDIQAEILEYYLQTTFAYNRENWMCEEMAMKLYLDIQDEPKKYGLKRYTERTITSFVRNNAKIRDMNRHVEICIYELTQAKMLLSLLETKLLLLTRTKVNIERVVKVDQFKGVEL